LHNIYEFGRCFLDEKDINNIRHGKKVFQYLSDIDIIYFIKPTNELIDSDLVYAITGGRILPYLDKINTVAAKEEICRLASGYCDRAQGFIQNRENGLTKSASLYRSTVIRLNIGVKKPKDFNILRNDWGYRRSILDGSGFDKKTRNISNSRLFSKPEKYPYLNTYINAQLYFNFIALTSYQGPSKKSTSDYRHLIDANATDLFVTKDKRMKNNSLKIVPFLKIYSLDEFKSIIS